MVVIRAGGGRALAVGVAVVFSTAASADWCYCYSSPPDQHRSTCRCRLSKCSPGDAFRRMLDERGIQPRAVVCPRGHDQAEVQERIDHAASYNRQNGNTV